MRKLIVLCMVVGGGAFLMFLTLYLWAVAG